jgi:hypothetical protein
MISTEKRWLWIGGLTLGAAGLLFAGIELEKKAVAATPPPPTPPANGLPVQPITQPVLTVGPLTPGNMQTAARVDQTIYFILPPGASWADNSSTVAADGLSNLTLQSTGNGTASVIFSGIIPTSTITLKWIGSTGTSQSTTVTIGTAP